MRSYKVNTAEDFPNFQDPRDVRGTSRDVPGCHQGKAFLPCLGVRHAGSALGDTTGGPGPSQKLMAVRAFAAAHWVRRGAHQTSSAEHGVDVVQPAGASAGPPALGCCPAEHRGGTSPHGGHPLTFAHVPQSSLTTLLLLHGSVKLRGSWDGVRHAGLPNIGPRCWAACRSPWGNGGPFACFTRTSTLLFCGGLHHGTFCVSVQGVCPLTPL